jgi:hypothetical protein
MSTPTTSTVPSYSREADIAFATEFLAGLHRLGRITDAELAEAVVAINAPVNQPEVVR